MQRHVASPTPKRKLGIKMKQEISKHLAFPMDSFTLYDVEDNEIDDIEIDAVKDGILFLSLEEHDGYNHINDIMNALGLVTINLTAKQKRFMFQIISKPE